MLLDRLDADPIAFAEANGWEIKPEGACKGEVCVPLPDTFALTDLADRLGMAVVDEPARDLWAVGPETVGGRALVTARAPDPDLVDLEGNPFRLSSLRGAKVVLVAWAPY